MDMIRWLATNKVVVAVWGLGILAMLLAWIFGGSSKVEQKAAAVETKVVETVAEVSKPATASVTAAATVATAAVASTVQSAVDTGSEAVKEVSTEAETTVADAADATAEAASESQQVASTAATAAGSEAATEQSNAVKEDDLAGKSSDDLLMMARESYWDNGLDKAASLYAELITREPNVIEHKGELGNVFWRQGYPKKAAELYADIAEPMIAKGNGERVSNMVGFIGLFFPERASAIRKLLDAQ